MSSPTFADLGVPSNIYQALDARGISSPFAIQAVTIADALAGRDVCGRAPTGSGKTLAFGIPLVASVGRADPRRPRGLVLAPTRELAEQIRTEIRSFAGKVRVGVVYGGVGYGPQLKALRDGIDILVACPGRLEDLIEQGAVDLRDVDRVVLDEADRMADMGFMPAVRRLLDQTAKVRQTVLFSATLDGDIAKLTRDYQNDPVRHEVGDETPDIAAATHLFWNVGKTERVDLAAKAVAAAWPAIIFCRTRHGADRLAKQLERSDIKAAAIHGGRSQSQRTRALADFSNSRVHALVATDVAARGIHVDRVAAVIHFDPPEDHKAYVHRSGRTARAGEGGVVISLVQPDQKKDVRRLQRDIGLEQLVTTADLALVCSLTTGDKTLAAPQDRPQRREGRNNDRSADHQSRRNRSQGNRHNSQKRSENSRSGNGAGNRQGGPKRNGKPNSRGGDSGASSSSHPKGGNQKHGGQKTGGKGQGQKTNGPRSSAPRHGAKPGQRRNGKPSNTRRNAA
ncbi:MAG: DEAD/DEAH box helicase [Acidimicrobiales bacterium]|nr:DEAD/DEAH box helicase [Acidimicrobiales bacterium]